MRTSKKQMQEAEKSLRYFFPTDLVYSRLERDASGKAYVKHNGVWFEFKSNNEAWYFAMDLVMDAIEATEN